MIGGADSERSEAKSDSSMEMENRELKRKYASCRASLRSCKERLKYQSSRSRDLITAVSIRLEEANQEAMKVDTERRSQLEYLSRELLLLQANMQKEQKRLKNLTKEKDEIIQSQQAEIERLKRQNKRLYNMATAKIKKSMSTEGNDTSTSEDSSPKSSFSKVPKVELKPRGQISDSGATGESHRQGTLNNPMCLTPESSSDFSSMSITPEPATPLSDSIISDLDTSRSKLVKPPVPSRAGVNKKLQITSPRKQSEKDERADSGRESDETFDSDNFILVTNDKEQEESGLIVKSIAALKPDFLAASSPRSSGRSSASINELQQNLNDMVINKPEESMSSKPNENNKSRGYSSFLADAGLNQRMIMSPIHQMTNHKGVKPSDIKYRAKFRTASAGISSIEQQLDDNTTVTYWTEPFL